MHILNLTNRTVSSMKIERILSMLVVIWMISVANWLSVVNAEDFDVLHGSSRLTGDDTELTGRVVRSAASSVRVKRQSSSYIDSIINHSNYLRRTRGSSNMFKMVWDNNLAKAAAEWTSRCVWKHGYPTDVYPYPDGLTDVGENLFATTSSNLNTTFAVQSWFDEVKNYDYDGPCAAGQVCGTCAEGKVCGHYTQVVWWNSYRMGCAHKYCTVLKESKWSTIPATVFMCYYAPPGNYIGQRPYLKGAPCSACGADPNNFYCDQQLCCYKPLNNATTAKQETTQATTIEKTTQATTNEKTTVVRQTTVAEVTTVAERTTAAMTPQPLVVSGGVTTADAATATTEEPKTTTGEQAESTVALETTVAPDQTTINEQQTTVTEQKSTKEVETTTNEQQTTARDLTTQTLSTGGDTTTSSAENTSISTCGDSTCPNGCELSNQVCCGCRTFAFHRDCTCCPQEYTCCPPSLYFPLGAGCCPPGSQCIGDGSCMFKLGPFTVLFPARSTTYARTPTCPTESLLAITADNGIMGLSFDGNQVPLSSLPNRFYPDLLDLVPLPGDVRVISVLVLNTYGRGGLFARSTDGRVTGWNSWRCMDYTSSTPPQNWTSVDFEDFLWPYSAVYFRSGIVHRGYPYYRLAPRDSELEWVWINRNLGPGNFVYCRLTLPA